MFPPYENVYLGLDELMTSIVLAKGVYPYAYFTGPIDFSSRNISETISPKHYQISYGARTYSSYTTNYRKVRLSQQ